MTTAFAKSLAGTIKLSAVVSEIGVNAKLLRRKYDQLEKYQGDQFIGLSNDDICRRKAVPETELSSNNALRTIHASLLSSLEESRGIVTDVENKAKARRAALPASNAVEVQAGQEDLVRRARRWCQEILHDTRAYYDPSEFEGIPVRNDRFVNRGLCYRSVEGVNDQNKTYAIALAINEKTMNGLTEGINALKAEVEQWKGRFRPEAELKSVSTAENDAKHKGNSFQELSASTSNFIKVFLGSKEITLEPEIGDRIMTVFNNPNMVRTSIKTETPPPGINWDMQIALERLHPSLIWSSGSVIVFWCASFRCDRFYPQWLAGFLDDFVGRNLWLRDRSISVLDEQLLHLAARRVIDTLEDQLTSIQSEHHQLLRALCACRCVEALIRLAICKDDAKQMVTAIKNVVRRHQTSFARSWLLQAMFGWLSQPSPVEQTLPAMLLQETRAPRCRTADKIWLVADGGGRLVMVVDNSIGLLVPHEFFIGAASIELYIQHKGLGTRWAIGNTPGVEKWLLMNVPLAFSYRQ